jgi:hypothetical protein
MSLAPALLSPQQAAQMAPHPEVLPAALCFRSAQLHGRLGDPAAASRGSGQCQHSATRLLAAYTCAAAVSSVPSD